MLSVRGKSKIAVIGAGVVGLSTAVCVQDLIPDCHVTIFADKFYKETCSYGAAGISRPPFELAMEELEDVADIRKDSMDHYYRIARSSEAKEAGIKVISGYYGTNEEQSTEKFELMKGNFCLDLERVTKATDDINKQIVELCTNVFHITTVMTECAKYLPWLTKKFERAGGIFIQRKLKNSELKALNDRFDCVVFCCGLGARELLDDHQVVPIRGQVIKVKPTTWMKEFIFVKEIGYIYPGAEWTVCGGIFQKHNYKTTIDNDDRTSILRGVERLLPNLLSSEIIGEWVGLRPYRPRFCIEITKHPNTGVKPIVCNYGHGGRGVNTSWGSALRAAKFVKTVLESREESRRHYSKL